jgi:hypothetical protein
LSVKARTGNFAIGSIYQFNADYPFLVRRVPTWHLQRAVQDIVRYQACPPGGHSHTRQAPLKDAAAVNTIRWALTQALTATSLPLELASGGRTKWNRTRLGLPKTYALDALYVSQVDAVSGW